MCTFKASYTFAWYPRSQMFWIYSSILLPLVAPKGGGAIKMLSPYRFIYVYALEYNTKKDRKKGIKKRDNIKRTRIKGKERDGPENNNLKEQWKKTRAHE